MPNLKSKYLLSLIDNAEHPTPGIKSVAAPLITGTPLSSFSSQSPTGSSSCSCFSLSAGYHANTFFFSVSSVRHRIPHQQIPGSRGGQAAEEAKQQSAYDAADDDADDRAGGQAPVVWSVIIVDVVVLATRQVCIASDAGASSGSHGTDRRMSPSHCVSAGQGGLPHPASR